MRKWVSSPSHSAAVETLICARKAKGLTQRAVAAQMGKPHHTFLAKIEAGERRLDLIEFIAIARAIGVDELELFADLVSRLPSQIDV